MPPRQIEQRVRGNHDGDDQRNARDRNRKADHQQRKNGERRERTIRQQPFGQAIDA